MARRSRRARNGVGTLTVNGNLALGAGFVLDFEFGQANVAGGALNDLVNVGGDLTLDGTINVSVPASGSFGPGIYRVFNYGGTLTDNGLTLGTLPGGSAVSVQTAVAGQVNLVNTAGLTLSFWDGDAGPKNNGAIDGGNGVWRVGGGTNNWTDANGALNADYAQNSFAIFSGAAGRGHRRQCRRQRPASGMQFASDGYTITGDALTLTGAPGDRAGRRRQRRERRLYRDDRSELAGTARSRQDRRRHARARRAPTATPAARDQRRYGPHLERRQSRRCGRRRSVSTAARLTPLRPTSVPVAPSRWREPVRSSPMQGPH